MNIDDMKPDTSEAAQNKAKDEAFAKFLEEPTTKFVLTFIPEGRDADAVRTILRASFNAGFSCGGGFFVGDLLKTLMKGDRRPR